VSTSGNLRPRLVAVGGDEAVAQLLGLHRVHLVGEPQSDLRHCTFPDRPAGVFRRGQRVADGLLGRVLDGAQRGEAVKAEAGEVQHVVLQIRRAFPAQGIGDVIDQDVAHGRIHNAAHHHLVGMQRLEGDNLAADAGGLCA